MTPKKAISHKRYEQSPKGKVAHKRYQQSLKGKESIKRYQQSKKGRSSLSKCISIYQHSKKGKIAVAKADKKFRQTPKGRANIRKSNAKRRGYCDTELFPNPFDESVKIEWHHASNEFIVAIPRDLHILYIGFKEHRELVMGIVKQIYIEGD